MVNTTDNQGRTTRLINKEIGINMGPKNSEVQISKTASLCGH